MAVEVCVADVEVAGGGGRRRKDNVDQAAVYAAEDAGGDIEEGRFKGCTVVDDADATFFLGDEEAPALVAGVGDLDWQVESGGDGLEGQSRLASRVEGLCMREAEHSNFAPCDPAWAIEGDDEDLVDGLGRVQFYVEQLPVVRVDL